MRAFTKFVVFSSPHRPAASRARAGIAYLLVGVIDYVWARWRHERSLRMDRQEVKEEHKQEQLPNEVRAAIRPRDQHAPISKMLVIENTHNKGGGTVWPQDKLDAVLHTAHENGMATHMDGARLMNAAVALGHPAKEIAAHGAGASESVNAASISEPAATPDRALESLVVPGDAAPPRAPSSGRA